MTISPSLRSLPLATWEENTDFIFACNGITVTVQKQVSRQYRDCYVYPTTLPLGLTSDTNAILYSEDIPYNQLAERLVTTGISYQDQAENHQITLTHFPYIEGPLDQIAGPLALEFQLASQAAVKTGSVAMNYHNQQIDHITLPPTIAGTLYETESTWTVDTTSTTVSAHYEKRWGALEFPLPDTPNGYTLVEARFEFRPYSRTTHEDRFAGMQIYLAPGDGLVTSDDAIKPAQYLGAVDFDRFERKMFSLPPTVIQDYRMNGHSFLMIRTQARTDGEVVGIVIEAGKAEYRPTITYRYRPD